MTPWMSLLTLLLRITGSLRRITLSVRVIRTRTWLSNLLYGIVAVRLLGHEILSDLRDGWVHSGVSGLIGEGACTHERNGKHRYMCVDLEHGTLA